MGEDLSIAAERLSTYAASVRAIVLRGAGAHLSPGGNHYRNEGATPLAAAAAALRRTFAGFAAIRALGVPLVCAAHGTVIGGGIAVCLNCDYLVAEGSTTFEHGNLVRGVCPLGGLSRTLPHVAGRARALAIYLGNDTLSAAEAQTAGIVHEVRKRLHRSSTDPCSHVPCALASALARRESPFVRRRCATAAWRRRSGALSRLHGGLLRQPRLLRTTRQAMPW